MSVFLKPGNPAHYIDEVRTEHAIILRCKCGWAWSTPRNLPPLQRATQIQAAIRRHELDYRR